MLAGELPEVTVINADGTVAAELEEEQVGEADFFVATSGSDEDNVMTCLQAHNLGVKNCLTLIHRADYAQAISASGRHFGVVAAVSPREAARREVERFVTEESYHVVKRLTAGEVVETRVAEGGGGGGQGGGGDGMAGGLRAGGADAGTAGGGAGAGRRAGGGGSSLRDGREEGAQEVFEAGGVVIGCLLLVISY